MPKDSPKSKSANVEPNVEQESDVPNYIECNDFKIENFKLQPIDEKFSSDQYFHSFPQYKYGDKMDKFIIKTKPIKITKGGLPRTDDNWYKTDATREFIWLGEDDSQENLNELFSVFSQIDEYFDKKISYDDDEKVDNNVKSKTVVFQREKNKVEPLQMLDYIPIIKETQQPEDDKSGKEFASYKRCKLRFTKKYDANKEKGTPNQLTTSLFLGDNDEPEKLEFASDYEKYLRWNCTAAFVLQISKMRCDRMVQKAKKGKTVPRECTFDINILQVVITEQAPQTGVSNAEKYRKRIFSNVGTQKPQIESKKSTKDESSSESESESDSDSDSKQVKNTKKQSKQEDSDSDGDTKKVTKETHKKSKKVESSSESEDESQEDDSEDDSEDDKMKKKTKSSSK